MTRPMAQSVAIASALFLAPLVAGCADDNTTGEEHSICEDSDTVYQDITVGLVQQGADRTLKVRVVGTDPAPPARGDNIWTVQLLDMSEAPLSDATLMSVKPWMPDHDHGTSVTPAINAMPAEAEFQVSAINFRMAGVWTLEFTAQSGGSIDTATFGVCVDP